jgi:tRNA dimethylallyltransferase
VTATRLANRRGNGVPPRAGPTLAIGGPTATGKTALAVELARHTGAELINADSRQVVRRLRVGTAAPTASDLHGIRCHLLDLCEPGEPFTVAQWLEQARVILEDQRDRGVPAIVVGGTGQYLRALRVGWDFGGAPPDPGLRAELTATASTGAGMERLVMELRARDPTGAATVDLANPRRVIRAIELLRAGGVSLSESRRQRGGWSLDVVVLDAERTLHAEALEARLDAMFSGGAIVTEVRAELEGGTTPAALRRAGIGYGEAIDVLTGRADLASARAAALQRTRRYVKAQRTWFRHEPALLRLERTRETTTSSLAARVLAAFSPTGGARS